MMDDQWRDMSLITLSISNSGKKSGNGLYFDDAGEPLKVKLPDKWIDVNNPLTKVGFHEVYPGQRQFALLVLPADAQSFRISLKWTGSVLKKGRLAWLLQRLPASLRNRVSTGVWRRAGYMEYGPASRWQAGVLDIALPAKESTIH